MILAALTVCVLSLIGVVLMIQTAAAEGFAVLEVPLIVLEVIFLGAVFLFWLGLRGSDDEFESERRPRASREAPASPRSPVMQERERGIASDGDLRSRIARLADWWFNGLRDPRLR